MSFFSKGTYPEVGQKVQIVNLSSTKGFLIAEKHLKARRAISTGIVQGYVPGHGGDVWWIKHDDGSVAAYGVDEMEPASSG